MHVRVLEWDLEYINDDGDSVVASFEEAGVTEGQSFRVDAESVDDAIDVISDMTGWCIKSAEAI